MDVGPNIWSTNMAVWHDLRIRLYWAYNQGLPESFRKRMYNAHPQAAWLLLRGSVKLHFTTHEEKYECGQWIFPRGEDGMQEFSEDAELLSVRFDAVWPTGDFLFSRGRSYALPALRAKRFTRISERLAFSVEREFPGIAAELPQSMGSMRQHFAFQGLLSAWIVAYADAMQEAGAEPYILGKLDSRIREAIHVLEIRPLSHRLKERELAARVGLSLSQFNKLFVREVGKTPKEYWEEKRCAAARLGLQDASISVKSLALDLGFSSLPHFSAWASKKLGMSPRKFREGVL